MIRNLYGVDWPLIRAKVWSRLMAAKRRECGLAGPVEVI